MLGAAVQNKFDLQTLHPNRYGAWKKEHVREESKLFPRFIEPCIDLEKDIGAYLGLDQDRCSQERII